MNVWQGLMPIIPPSLPYSFIPIILLFPTAGISSRQNLKCWSNGFLWFQSAAAFPQQSSTLGYGESTYPGTNDRTPELTFSAFHPPFSFRASCVLVIKLSNNYLKNRIQNNDLFTTLSIGEQPVFFSSSRFIRGQAQPVPIDFAKKAFTAGFLPFQGRKTDRLRNHPSRLSYRRGFLSYHY